MDTLVPELRGELICRLWSYVGQDKTNSHRHNYTISMARCGNDTQVLSVGQNVHEKIQAVPEWKTTLMQILCGRNKDTDFYCNFIRHHRALEALRDLDFGYKFRQISDARAIIDMCIEGNCRFTVNQAKAAFDSYEIQPEDLRKFIEQDLMRDYSPSHLFIFDYAFSALAVALRENKGQFAEVFLRKTSEASSNHRLSREVAGLILKIRG